MGKKDINIVLLRFIAITLIVYHHSISSLSGWPPVDISLPTLPMPVLFSSGLAKNIGLVLFTFISGYLITYSTKPYSIGYLWQKVKKVLFPCVVVASVYYFLFPSMMFDSDPVNGTHLWYLPMIFLFYVFSLAVKTKQFLKSIVLILLVFGFFVLMGKLTSLRTFSECIRYWPAFVGGGYFSRFFSNSIIQRKAIFIAFALILMVDPGIQNLLSILIICCVLYLLVYLARNFVEETRVYKWATLVSNTSFEIYLFHQFVINALLVVAMQMKFSLFIVPLVSLIINMLALPYLILIEKRIVN